MENFKSYLIGFALSLLLTLTAFGVVIEHWLVGSILVLAILGLTFVQLGVQLIFFLHLDLRAKQRWNLAIFISTVGLILILVVGSLWIMKNLDYRHMSPADINDQIFHNEGFQK